MYDEKETRSSNIEWGNILRKVIKFVVLIIIVVLIFSLVTRCTRAVNSVKNRNTEAKTSLNTQLLKMQNATIKYATKENLPSATYTSKTIRLKELEDSGKIKNLKDSKGNVCSLSNSYSRITKLENNYMVRMYLTCGKNTGNKTFYIGCFDDCNGKVCLGSKSKKGGLCTNNSVESTTNTETNTNTSSNTNTSTSTNNSSDRLVDFGNSSNNTSSSNSNTSNNTYTPVTKTLYEYVKYRNSYACSDGTLEGNKCVKSYTATYAGYDYTNKEYKYTCPNGGTFNRNAQNKPVCSTKTDAILNRVIEDTLWSYNTSVDGYERTGQTKTITE